jgi:hypothetical protein
VSDARHHSEDDAAAALLAGIDLRLRGLALAADATEQIDLPVRAECALVTV